MKLYKKKKKVNQYKIKGDVTLKVRGEACMLACVDKDLVSTRHHFISWMH